MPPLLSMFRIFAEVGGLDRKTGVLEGSREALSTQGATLDPSLLQKAIMEFAWPYVLVTEGAIQAPLYRSVVH